jgi:hypothetical protein
MIPLRLTAEKDVKALFANFEPRGSMTRYLLFDGLKPQGHLSKRIRNRLNVREGYASYCAGNVIRGKFSYWFTDKLGFSSEHQIIDIDDLRRRAKNLRSMSSPGIAPPYPITKEEIAASRLR